MSKIALGGHEPLSNPPNVAHLQRVAASVTVRPGVEGAKH